MPIIVANWKMHKTSAEAVAFIRALRPASDRRVLLAPPFTAIEAAVLASQGTSLSIGAQNVSSHENGAFTGEVSASMLKASGAEFVIIGHSERRQLFGETNVLVRQKIERSLDASLTPIVCVGESLLERERGSQEQVLRTQLEQCLHGLDGASLSKCMVAYEPIWAIGTGKSATPQMAQEMHRFIRTLCRAPLLYGGSVNAQNVASFLAQPDIDGVLVGGASLDPVSFSQLIHCEVNR